MPPREKKITSSLSAVEPVDGLGAPRDPESCCGAKDRTGFGGSERTPWSSEWCATSLRHRRSVPARCWQD